MTKPPIDTPITTATDEQIEEWLRECQDRMPRNGLDALNIHHALVALENEKIRRAIERRKG